MNDYDFSNNPVRLANELPSDLVQEQNPLQHVHDLISDGRIYDAIDEMTRVAALCADYDLDEEVERFESDFQLLTMHFQSNEPDPKRPELYANLRRRAHDLTESIRTKLVLSGKRASDADRGKPYGQRERALANASATMGSAGDALRNYRNQVLFGLEAGDECNDAALALAEALFSSRLADDEVQALFDDFICDPSMPENDRAFAIGALCFNIMARHDRRVSFAIIAALYNKSLPSKVYGRLCAALVADITCSKRRWEEDTDLGLALFDLTNSTPKADDVLQATVFFFMQTAALPSVMDFVRGELVAMAKKVFDKLSEMLDNMGDLAAKMSDQDFQDKTRESIGSLISTGQSARISSLHAQLADWSYGGFERKKERGIFQNQLNRLRIFDTSLPSVCKAVANLDRAKAKDVLDVVESDITITDSDKFVLLDVLTTPLGFDGITMPQSIAEDPKAIGSILRDTGNRYFGPNNFDEKLAASQFVKEMYRAVCSQPGVFGTPAAIVDPKRLMSCKVLMYIGAPNDAVEILLPKLMKNEMWAEGVMLCENVGHSVSVHDLLARNFGVCLYKVGRFADAIEQFKRAVLMDEDDSFSKLRIAQCYHELRQPQSALFHIEDAERSGLKLDADDVALKADCLVAIGDYSKAYEVADAVEDANASLVMLKAMCLIATKRPAEAISLIESFFPDGARSPEVFVLLGQAQLAQGLKDKAVDSFEMAVQATADPLMVRKILNSNEKHLLSAGVSKLDISLALELGASMRNVR